MFDGKSLIKNENAFQLLQKIPTTHMGVSNHWTETWNETVEWKMEWND